MKFKAYAPKEGDEQASVFDWAEVAVTQYPELDSMYAIPNGVQIAGPKKWGAIMALKRRGLKKGFPDLGLPVPRGGYSALFIEMKRVDGGAGASDEQDWWIARLLALGNYAEICNGAAVAIITIRSYLEGRIKR